MMQKIYPVMVSTKEALEHALDSDWGAIYIEQCMMEKKIYQQMEARGYRISAQMCRRGVLFTKEPSSEIYDPMRIL